MSVTAFWRTCFLKIGTFVSLLWWDACCRGFYFLASSLNHLCLSKASNWAELTKAYLSSVCFFSAAVQTKDWFAHFVFVIVWPAPAPWICYTSSCTKEKMLQPLVSWVLAQMGRGRTVLPLMETPVTCWFPSCTPITSHFGLPCQDPHLFLVGIKQEGSVSLFCQWLKPCGFSRRLLRQSRELCEVKWCRGISVQCYFMGRRYEGFATLYVVKAQAVISMQQFL